MADKKKKLKRQVSTDGGRTWQDMIPYEYIAGELIERDSPDCNNVEWRTVSGYICEENTTEMTQWVADTGYVCVGFDKYNKEKEQVSYNSGISWADTGNTRAGSTLIEQNSEDCGYEPPITQWVADTGYVCVGYDKKNKEKEQQSTDGGTTWTDTGNTRAGSTLIEANSTDCGYVPHDYSTEYLTTEALGSGNISLKKSSGSGTKEPIKDVQYSKNNGAWTSYTYDTYGTFISVNTGDKIRWKATIKDGNDSSRYSYFASSADYKVYGNPLSLLDNDNFINNTDNIYNYAYSNLFYSNSSSRLKDASGLALPATTLADHCYYHMFFDCSSITTAPVLPATTLAPYCYEHMFYLCSSITTAPVLPATTLAKYCYYGMFQGCTSLTTAPALPATTLADHCYYYMFHGCTSLTTAPALPVTTLAESCYADMFENCTGLTTAPELPATTLAELCYADMFWNCTGLTTAPLLPATTLADHCYYRMFSGCSSLNSVTCCATDISASECTTNWLQGVSSTGTFVKNAAMSSWGTGDSGIPRGWATDTCSCGPQPITQWVADTGYVCVGYNKMNKEKEQISYDGISWTDTGNTRAGSTLIEANSTDCGYVPYSTEYLTTEALSSGEIRLRKGGYSPSMKPIKDIQYSKNGGDWTSYTYSTNISVATGDKIRWKGTIYNGNSTNYFSYFAATADYNVYGNPLSLLNNDSFVNEPGAIYDYAYYELFKDSRRLKDASGLALPATTLTKYCYYYMFEDCSSLTAAPALPATELANSCYMDMFNGCTSLTIAPKLPATSLTESCYREMFYNCNNLNNVTCLATNISASYATFSWLGNVSSTGTFTKAAGVTWSRNSDGIPSGWTVVEAT